MGYNSGFAAVQQAIDESKRSGGGTDYITWKPGESKVVRLVNDDPITIPVHSFVKCNDGRNREFVCSAALANPRPCYICENVQREYTDRKSGEKKMGKSYPTPTTIALAAIRKETSDDVVDELDSDDNIQIGMIKQGNTFWQTFLGYVARYQTGVDRDYMITREGEKLDTKYHIVSVEPTEDLRIKDGRKTNVEETRKVVAEHYAAALEGKPTLVDWIERMGSEEYYKKFLLDDAPAKDEDSEASVQETKTEDTPAPSQEEKPAEAKNDTQFASLKDRLTHYQAEQNQD